jgi:hypothetical protein
MVVVRLALSLRVNSVRLFLRLTQRRSRMVTAASSTGAFAWPSQPVAGRRRRPAQRTRRLGLVSPPQREAPRRRPFRMGHSEFVARERPHNVVVAVDDGEAADPHAEPAGTTVDGPCCPAVNRRCCATRRPIRLRRPWVRRPRRSVITARPSFRDGWTSTTGRRDPVAHV